MVIISIEFCITTTFKRSIYSLLVLNYTHLIRLNLIKANNELIFTFWILDLEEILGVENNV
jgi:hypothetical protein